MNTLTLSNPPVPAMMSCPEIELLLCCARTHLDPKTSERIRTLLQQDIDWAYLIETAAKHGVTQLLYQSLKVTDPISVPKPIISKMQQFFHINTLHNLLLTKELLSILNLFEKHNIAAIPLKGPVLAASVYGNLALRQFCDLDILVKKQDFLKAIDLLTSERYKTKSQQGWILNNFLYKLHLKYNTHEYTLIRNDGKIAVDIHNQIIGMNFLQLDFEHLCNSLEPISLQNKILLNFHPENLLLILCVHGSKHKWEKLQWICDIAEVVRCHQSMDWNSLMAQAQTLGCKRMLLMGLFLASNLLGLTLPEKVNQEIQADPQSKLLAIEARQNIFNVSKDSNEDSNLGQFWFDFRMLSRPKDKLSYCVYFISRVIVVRILIAISQLKSRVNKAEGRGQKEEGLQSV